jgi:hypothetical protein
MGPVPQVVVTQEAGEETSATVASNCGSRVVKGRRLNQCLAAIFGKNWSSVIIGKVSPVPGICTYRKIFETIPTDSVQLPSGHGY